MLLLDYEKFVAETKRNANLPVCLILTSKDFREDGCADLSCLRYTRHDWQMADMVVMVDLVENCAEVECGSVKKLKQRNDEIDIGECVWVRRPKSFH